MQKIRIDFDNPGLPQHISAVENDSQSRFFQATLYENGKAYTAPEGATYSIMYRGFGPQNQGWYDTINDGAGKRAACAVSGNVVTCEIARQALQVPGHVSIVLCVTTGKGYMLKSWPIECDCKNDRYDSTAEIQSFFYVTSVSNASWMQVIQAVEELKNIIDPTLSLSGKAADAKATGDAVGRLKEDLGALKYFTTTPTSPYDDCNTLPNNCKIWYTNGNYPKNLPKNISESGFVNIIAVNGYNNERTGGLQIAVYESGITFIRTYRFVGTWSEWTIVGDNEKHEYFTTTPTSPYDNCNTLPNNCKIWYFYGKHPKNSPAPLNEFLSIITINGYINPDNSGQTQIAISNSGLWTRFNTGAWSNWNKINSTSNICVYSDIIKSTFDNKKNPVFYGDSITAGSGVPDDSDYPTVLCKKIGIKSHSNYAVAGASYTNSTNSIISQLSNYDENDIIVISAGVNDCASNATLDSVRSGVKNVCDYLNANHPETPVIFITPIKGGGYKLNNLEKYINAISEVVVCNDIYNHFSLITGYNFAFPDTTGSSDYIVKVFQGKQNVHPSEYGVKTVYVPELCSRLIHDRIYENPCDYDGLDVCAFDTCICIGDSLTQGIFNVNRLESSELYNSMNYPKYFANMTGISVKNMGHAGKTTVGWWDTYKNSDLSGYKMAIIQLGANDYYSTGSSWTEESNTALSNIVTKLKAENNNIKIFIATIIPAKYYPASQFASISQGIRDFVSNLSDKNVICLDMAAYGHTNDEDAYNTGHLSAYGYWRLAKDYVSYISWYMHNYPSAFKEIQFIGTELTSGY